MSWIALLDCLPGNAADLGRAGRPSWRTGRSGDGLLAKLLGQLADLGLWEATVAAERLQKG
jgi:hypothetical protein